MHSALVLLVLALQMGQAAQVGQPTHTVQVQVTGPNGRPIDEIVKIEILDLDSIPIADTFNNRGGSTSEFPRRFMDGSYRLRVSGPAIETLMLQFDIAPTESIHRETVRVTFKSPTAAESGTVGPATVSANSLKIPGKAHDAFTRAMDAYAKNDLPKARQEFERAISLYPGYAEAHNNFGVMLLKTNDLVKARDQFQAALADDPKLATAHVNLARIALSENNYRGAESELDAALGSAPDLLAAEALLVTTAFHNGEADKALAAARQVHATAHHEQYAEVHLVAGEILLEKNFATDAASEYEYFTKEKPDDPRVAKVVSLVKKLKDTDKSGH